MVVINQGRCHYMWYMTSKLYLSAAFCFLAVFVFFGSGCSDGAGDYSAVIKEGENSNPGQLVNEDLVVLRELFFENKETNTTLTMTVGTDRESGKPVLTSPFVLSGLTFVFENSFLWRVKDGNGDMVAGGMAQADSPDIGIPGPYKIKGFFDILPQTKDGLLEIYYGSFKDGSDVILLSVPVVFGQMQTKEVEVFFSNVKKDPDMLDCSKVYAVKRTAVVTDPIQAVAMHELLLGPTVAEKDAGYVTSLPDYVNQPEVYWQGEGLFMNFDETLQSGVAGSCRVAAIRAQIENTMGDVCTDLGACYIMVNGSSEEVLQP
mgnify:FL=1